MTGRILLASGEATARSGLAARLADAFLDVSEARDGRAALGAARREEPSLVIADAAAAGLSGLALCRALKADAGLAHVPVIILADRDAQAERLAGLEAGADDFLALPVPDEMLLARIRSLLRVKMMIDELRLREETARDLGLPSTPGDDWAEAAEGPAPDLLLVASGDTASRRRAARLSAALRAQARRARDGREALAAAAAQAPDLVLIEPDPGPGAQQAALRLISALRARAVSRDAGIILITDDPARSALALDLGANDCVAAPADTAELVARLRLQLRRKRFSDRLRGAVRDGLMMAATDPLTGLYNRRYAEIHLARMLARCGREGAPLAVMLLDLDRFKAVNDARGHPAGDAVLRGFAERLRAEVRGADLVARLGGEEFCVAMPGAGEREARGAAERVRAAVAATPFPAPDGPPIPVTVSIGLAVSTPVADRAAEPAEPVGAGAETPGLAEPPAPPPRRPEAPLRRVPDAAGLIATADAALYRSKAGGRDRITLARG